MGFGTTFSMLAFLFIFAGMSIFVINAQQNITAAATAIQEQTSQSSQAQRQAISIQETSYAQNQERTWTITYSDEFNTGSFENTTTQADAVILDGAITGTYTSKQYDTGHNSNYTTIEWSAVGNVTFQIRSANTILELENNDFIGPDQTTNTYYENTGAAINDIHDNNRYIQYQATLNNSELQSTSIGVIRESGHATITLLNSGSIKLDPTHTDVYIDGIRIPRSSAHRVYQLQGVLDKRLWNPGEELTLTVFSQDGVSITVANDNAQTATII